MKKQTCMYFLQGRCRFGEKCYYSHQGFVQAVMIRHSISAFNQMAQKYQGQDFLGQSAQKQFQFNTEYIDCPITEQGRQLAQQTYLPSSFLTNKNREIDVIFVSPLNRALQTADLIIKGNMLTVKKIIVIPELTEVLSKICDFSGPLKDKIKHFPSFDFSQMDRFMKQHSSSDNPLNEKNWQDILVNNEYKKALKVQQQDGKRYTKILKEIFPTPLQSSSRCFQRSLKALDIMKAIVEKNSFKKVVIVSHNRILKYIDGRHSKGRATSFQNCEIRRLIF